MARGWDTQEKARAEIHRLTGWKVPQSVYAEWESGRRIPADANLERLQAFYGTEATTTAPDDSVAAAIRDQTEVIRLFVEETRLARVAQETTAQAVAEMVGRLDRFLDFASTRDGDGQPARAGSR